MTKHIPATIRQGFERMNRVILLAVAIAVSAGPIMFISQTATANQVTSRSVLISSAQSSATGVTYTFGLVPAASPAQPIQSMKFQACTTALGSCSAPAGLSFSSVGATGTVSGWTTNTNFTTGAGSNNCTASASIICASRTAASNETGTGVRTVAFTNLTNQNSSNCSGAVNCTFFVRMTTFSDTAYLTAVDTGTVASSTTQTFEVDAAIQEQLTFCIGDTTIDNDTSPPPACSSISGTSLNLGTLTSADTSVSPVTVGNGGDGNNGIAELSTNATNGTTVTYDAIQASTGTNHLGTLRVTGASCNAGAVNTDQCINAVGTTQAAITAGTENYGMTIAAVNCAATTAYSCSFAGGTYKLTRNANYDGTGGNTYPTDTNLVAGTTNAGYAWDETGTTATIATSSTVVDKEALILKFAATPNIVTPSGTYSVKADFVATPTF